MPDETDRGVKKEHLSKSSEPGEGARVYATDESADNVLRFRGGVVRARPVREMVDDEEEDGEDQEAVLHEVDDDDGAEVVSYEEMAQGRQYNYMCLQHEIPVYEDEDDYGDEEEEEEEEQVVVEESDGEFDVSDAEIADLLQMVNPSKFVPDARFLHGVSAPRVAAAGNTAGFMRVITSDFREGDKCDKPIVLRYRYNSFSAAASSVSGLKACHVERRIHVQFIAAASHAWDKDVGMGRRVAGPVGVPRPLQLFAPGAMVKLDYRCEQVPGCEHPGAANARRGVRRGRHPPAGGLHAGAHRAHDLRPGGKDGGAMVRALQHGGAPAGAGMVHDRRRSRR
jgi:hypothetical protein